MTGTILNAAGILIGGIVGLTSRKQLSQQQQVALKGLLGVAITYVGLKTTWVSLPGGFSGGVKQVALVVVAMIFGRLIGKLLHLQKAMNRLGRDAGRRLEAGPQAAGARPADGFIICSTLYCAAPLGILGAVLDGLGEIWSVLALKAVLDGLATMAIVRSFGWSPLLAIVPVVAWQGTVTLGTRLLIPTLAAHSLLAVTLTTGGMLVFCVALLVMEFRRVEVADYLPSLLVAPLLSSLLQHS